MSKVLSTQNSDNHNSVAHILRKKVVDHILLGDASLIEKNPNEVFHLCVQFLKLHSPDLFYYYASRQFSIAEMRIRFGIAFGFIGILSLIKGAYFNINHMLLTSIILILLSMLMVKDGYKIRDFYVRSVLRAIYIETTNPASTEFHKNDPDIQISDK